MNRAAPLLVLLIVAAGGFAAFTLLRPRVDLLVVNTTPGAVRVQANGQEVALEPGERRALQGLSAALSLRALGPDGAALAAIDTSCAGARTWVFSVAPVTTWWVVSKGYGDVAHLGSSCAPFTASGPLFPLAEDYLPQVDEPMPVDLRVKKGVTGAVRKALWTDAYARREHPPTVWLAVHVSSRMRVALAVNGAKMGRLPEGAVAHIELPPGPVSLKARSDDGQEFEASGDLQAAPPLAPMPTYVWDVDGTARFHVVSRRYGRDPDAQGPAPSPRPFEGQTKGLFRLPEGFFHEVDADMPDSYHQARVLEFLWCEQLLAKKTLPPELQGIPMEDHQRGAPPTPRTPRRGRAPRPPTEPPPSTEPPFPPVDEGGG